MFVGPIPSASSQPLDPGTQHTPGAPVICSEFGGVNIIPAKGTAAGERDWGYTTASDPEDLLSRLENLVMAVVKGGHTCGLVYTQLYVSTFFLVPFSTDHLIVPVFLRCPSRGYGYDKHDS